MKTCTQSFIKMHGCGNDYIFIDVMEKALPQPPEMLAPKLSDRHFGIGGDGLVLILRSDIADARMRMFNADGSEGAMCGNAIRCVGKYLYDHAIVPRESMTIETASGIKQLGIIADGGCATAVRVDMGHAQLSAKSVPVDWPGQEVIIDQPYTLGDGYYRITCLSMGNPHCVLLNQVDLETLDIEAIGSALESAPIFPDRANIIFANVHDAHHMSMRVYERGSGETLACGTGACAAVVAAVENGLVANGEAIEVRLRGGTLLIEYDCAQRGGEGTVYMTGPATEVYKGSIEL